LEADLQHRSEQARPLALAAADLVGMKVKKGTNITADRYDPAGLELRIRRAKRTCNPAAAKTWQRLNKAGQIPSWAIALASKDLELIEDAAK
jgi:hypothetical protein